MPNDLLLDLQENPLYRNPYESYAVLQNELMHLGSAALVYFTARWCEDCQANGASWNAFISHPDTEIVGRKGNYIIRVPASIVRPDWKYENGDKNVTNPFRQKPLEIQGIPTASVIRFNPEMHRLEDIDGITHSDSTVDDLHRMWTYVMRFNYSTEKVYWTKSAL